jgi:hypothetical protein
MAPPDRDEQPRDTSVLDDARIEEDSRLRHNAARLTSWVEWLLHPEEHSYDRTVLHPGGHKREEPGPVAMINDQPGTLPSDAQLPFESVIEGYQPWQFLHGMAAVAWPRVERADSALGVGAAALYNVWWTADRDIPSLVDLFPTIGWEGDAADKAFTFLLDLQTVTGQVNKLVQELYSVGAKYAVIIKGARDSLDEAAAGLVRAFEQKFAAKPESQFSVDFTAAVLAGIAAAAVSFATVGTGALVTTALVTSTWSNLFTDVAGDALKSGDDAVGGYWWRDLVESYMHKQALILTAAQEEVNQLNRVITNLIGRFNGDPAIQAFVKDYVS